MSPLEAVVASQINPMNGATGASVTPAQVGVAERLAEREDEKSDGKRRAGDAGCEELRDDGVDPVFRTRS